mgnify:CR=1 FL=1
MAKNKWSSVRLTRAFSWTTAEHMAELSRDAYLKPEEFKKIYPRAKFVYHEESVSCGDPRNQINHESCSEVLNQTRLMTSRQT